LVNRIAQRPNISIYLLSGQQIFTTIRLSLLVNIVRTVARKPANHLKFCWLKVICCICQSNELEIKQRTVGGKTGGQPKTWGSMAHPGSPLEPPLLSVLVMCKPGSRSRR